MQGGSTFTVTCTPDATSSVTGYGGVNTSVIYSASAVAVTVGVDGLTSVGPSTWGVLVGQGLAVSLSTSNWTQSAWQWSISGDPFAGFQVTATTGGAVELAGTHMLTSEGFTFYYRSIQDAGPDTSTITCTATVKDPKGGVHQVTGTTQVSVYAPAVSFTEAIGSVGIGVIGGNPYLIAASSPGYLTGITWIGTVTPPASFGASNGNWGAAQLIQPKGNMTKQDGTAWQDPSQGLKGLDGQFTYLYHLLAADGNPHTDSDSPGYQLQVGFASVTMGPTFWTTMVYQPNNAGQGTTWVPIWELDWWAAGGAIFRGNTWTMISPEQGSVVVTNNAATKTLPSWAQVLTPGAWVKTGQ